MKEAVSPEACHLDTPPVKGNPEIDWRRKTVVR